VKQLDCRDIGFDCDETIRGESEQEIMSQAAEHAREAHGLTEIDEDTGQRIRQQIRDV
jgi:predicted small metal-binding protein